MSERKSGGRCVWNTWFIVASLLPEGCREGREAKHRPRRCHGLASLTTFNALTRLLIDLTPCLRKLSTCSACIIDSFHVKGKEIMADDDGNDEGRLFPNIGSVRQIDRPIRIRFANFCPFPVDLFWMNEKVVYWRFSQTKIVIFRKSRRNMVGLDLNSIWTFKHLKNIRGSPEDLLMDWRCFWTRISCTCRSKSVETIKFNRWLCVQSSKLHSKVRFDYFRMEITQQATVIRIIMSGQTPKGFKLVGARTQV